MKTKATKGFTAEQIEKLTYWEGLKKNKKLEKVMLSYVKKETEKYLKELEGQILLYADWGCSWALIHTHPEPHIFLNAADILKSRGFIIKNQGDQWSILWGTAKRCWEDKK